MPGMRWEVRSGLKKNLCTTPALAFVMNSYYHRRVGDAFRIPKGGGRFRLVVRCLPIPKRRLRRLIPDLVRLHDEMEETKGLKGISHGSLLGRSPWTNAAPHVGYKYTLVMDLEDCFNSLRAGFFDPITTIEVQPGLCSLRPRFRRKDRKHVQSAYRSPHGAPLQGLPSSPIICNLLLMSVDYMLKDWIGDMDVAYTRYLDDLTFSANSRSLLECIIKPRVGQVAEQYGLKIAEHKTRLYQASKGRRMVTGLAVGEDDVKAPRRFLRQYRAAVNRQYHAKRYSTRRRATNKAAGLKGWMDKPDGSASRREKKEVADWLASIGGMEIQ